MGVGTVTGARETTHGAVHDGGRTLAPQGTTFDPAKARVDPFAARKIQIESLRPVAEAMRRHEVATKGIEAVSATRLDLDEIQNGNPDGDGNGNFKGKWYSRKDGIWYDPPTAQGLTDEVRRLAFAKAEEEIAFRKGERLRGEANDMRTFVDTETARDIEMWRGSCEEALTVAKLGETFARTEQALVNDAGTVNSSALGQIAMDEANARKLAEVSGGSFDAAKATRDRTEQLARQYVRQNLEGRAKAATSFAVQSGGLMPPEKAMERANRIYDGMAKDFLDNLVAAGKFGHARVFANHAEELGYRGEVKAEALAAIDAAEMGAAVNEANVAISTIRDADGNYPAVETIERSIATLQRVGAAQPKGSKLAASAAEAVAKLDRHADEIRVGEFFDGFGQAQPDELDLSKVKNPYKKGTRDARCWDAARTAWVKNLSPEFNRERAAARKDAIDLMKAKQLDYVRDPQKGPAKYYEDLIGLERNGVITELDRKELIQKFEEGWAKGFVGQGNEQAMLLQKAEAVAKTLDEELGGAFRTEIRRDKDGFIKPAADGSLVYDPKAAPTDLTWREEVVGKSKTRIVAPGWSVHTPSRYTVKHTLTAEEKLGIANKALALAKFDGMELGYDPVTGIPMEKGEKYKVNLVTDLKRMCGILKSRKEAERVRDQVFDSLRRGKPATVGDAIGGIDPLAAVRGPLGSFGAMTRTIGEYDAEVQADRTKAERRKFSLGGMLQGLESESRSVKD